MLRCFTLGLLASPHRCIPWLDPSICHLCIRRDGVAKSLLSFVPFCCSSSEGEMHPISGGVRFQGSCVSCVTTLLPCPVLLNGHYSPLPLEAGLPHPLPLTGCHAPHCVLPTAVQVAFLSLLSHTGKSGLLCLALIAVFILISPGAFCPVIFLHFLCIIMSDLLTSLESKLTHYG